MTSARREERPLSDEERAELYRKQLKQLHVIDLVRDMMVTLVTVGYEKLGLTEQTRELRDLGDARVAIESLRRLIEVVEGEGDPETASLRSTLAQMQLNFARAASAEPRHDAAARPCAGRSSRASRRAASAAAASAPPEERSEADAQPSAEGENEPAMAPTKPAATKPAAKRREAAAEGRAEAGDQAEEAGAEKAGDQEAPRRRSPRPKAVTSPS